MTYICRILTVFADSKTVPQKPKGRPPLPSMPCSRTSDFCLLSSILCLLSSVLCLSGCRMDTQKAITQADQKAYSAIQSKWQDTYGTPTDISVDPNEHRQAMVDAILEDTRRTQTLGLEQAIQLAVLAGPEYRDRVEQLYLTALEQWDAEHLYALIPMGGAMSVYQTNGTDETITSQGYLGVQQLLSTGATVAADITLSSLDVLTGNLKSGSSSIFRTAVVQPLLRGADRVAVLETLTQAQQNTLYAVRDFNRFRKTYCASIVSDYYQLSALSLRTQNAADNIRQLQRLVEQMTDLVSVGRLGRYELQEAQQDLLKAHDDYLDFQRSYAEALDLFKVRLNIPPHVEFEPDLSQWLMLSESIFAENGWNEQTAIDIALSQRLDLANMQDQIADAQRKIRVAEDALGADLALAGSAAPASGDTDSQYELGLTGTLPLDRVAEAANYRRATIALTTQNRLYQQHTHLIAAEVRKAWRDMAEAKDRYLLQQQGRELARKRLENTTLLLHYGRANTRDVLDAQEDLYDAEDDFINALADFAVAQMNFLRDTETLWILPDGTYETLVASQ
jgi:outer membrane protein TolC